MRRRHVLGFVVLGFLAGCGNGPSPPPPADPARAREALQSALDAWQRGAKPNTLRDAAPPINVNDHEWSAGQQLTRYRIADDRREGVEQSFRVALTLKRRDGRTVQKTVSYKVGTEPGLSVVRSDLED